MKIRRIVIVLLILVLFLEGGRTTTPTPIHLDNDPSISHSVEFESCSSGVILIEGDWDFEDYDLQGNGTIENPYIIANEEIEGLRCIEIRDTRSYFRIVDCILNANSSGIRLVNVQNGEIIENTIYSRSIGIDLDSSNSCIIVNNTIKADYDVIRVSESTPCTIANNTIFCCGDRSVYIENSMNSIVITNSILSSWYGVIATRCSNSIILNNKIIAKYHALSVSDSTNSSIFGNQFACLIGEIALDYDGSNNSWDNGVSLGNAWYDYLGYGEYNISGNTNSTDHFPTKFEPLFPMDFDGPYIDASISHLCVDYNCEYPDSWRFTATITDVSGVDSVIIKINGISYFMRNLPTSEDPDQYIYDHPNPRSMTYSYWANDSLGWSSESREGYISIGVFSCTNSTVGTTIFSPEIIMIISSSTLLVIFIVAVMISKKRKLP